MLSIKTFSKLSLLLFSSTAMGFSAKSPNSSNNDIIGSRYNPEIYYWDNNVFYNKDETSNNEEVEYSDWGSNSKLDSSLPEDGGGGFDDDDDEPVPIDQGLPVLLITAVVLCIYFTSKQKKINNN